MIKKIALMVIIASLLLMAGVASGQEGSEGLRAASPDGAISFEVPSGWTLQPVLNGDLLIYGEVDLVSYNPGDSEIMAGGALVQIAYTDLIGPVLAEQGMTLTDLADALAGSEFDDTPAAETNTIGDLEVYALTGSVDDMPSIVAATTLGDDGYFLFQIDFDAAAEDAVVEALATILTTLTYDPVAPSLASLTPITATTVSDLVLVEDLSNDEADFYSADLSPDASFVAFEDSGSTYIYDVQTGDLLHSRESSFDSDTGISLEHSFPQFLDATTLVYSNTSLLDDGDNYEWSSLGSTVVLLPEGEALDLEFEVVGAIPNSTILLTIAEDPETYEVTVGFFDIDTGETVGGFTSSHPYYGFPVLAAEGNVWATVGDEGITIFSTDDYNLESPLAELSALDGGLDAAALSPDGSVLVAGWEMWDSPYTNFLTAIDTTTGEIIWEVDFGDEDPLVLAEYTSAGDVLFVVQRANLFALDAATGQTLRATYMAVDGSLAALAIADDGSMVLTAGYEGAALWGVPAE